MLRAPNALLVALAVAWWTTTALAQAPAPSDPVSPVAEPSQAVLDEARERFGQGLELARQGNCAGALGELRASFELAPRPNTLFNIARCHEELFHYDLAIDAYERYLTMAPPDDPDRGAVEATMRALNNLLGTVIVESNVEAELWVDDRAIATAPGRVRVPGGRHVIELRRDGYVPARREVDVTSRREVQLSLELREAEQRVTQRITQRVTVHRDRGLSPAYFWTGVGLTAACGVAGTLLGLRALSLQSDAEVIDPRLPRDREREDVADAALVADVAWGATAVFGVGTVIIYFLTEWGPQSDITRDRGARLTPFVSPSTMGVSVGGAL